MMTHRPTSLQALSPAGVAVVIPAHNEEDRIGATVSAVMTLAGLARIIVVDDGSEDNTTGAALKAGAHRVLTLPRNLGKGGALNAGLAEVDEEHVLLLDADLGGTATEAALLMDPVLKGETDMSIATLPRTGKGGGFGFAVGLSRLGIRWLGGQSMTAPLSGQRCATRALLEKCLPLEKGFGVETALTIDALRAGYRVKEIETAIAHRVTGRDLGGVLHRFRQFRDILWTVLRRIGRTRKMRVSARTGTTGDD